MHFVTFVLKNAFDFSLHFDASSLTDSCLPPFVWLQYPLFF
jgi:hypothetical protein